jgi:ribosomal protein L37E
MKLKNLKGFPEKSYEGDCGTCEHKDDSSQEYCGSCGYPTSMWKEAGWVKDNRLKAIGELEIEIDVEKVIKVLWSKAWTGTSQTMIGELAQAITKADIIKVKK